MKKTFKKSIACLLAVLMVVFSVPFTAMAAEAGPVDGYYYGPSEYGSNDKKIWWDESNPPTAEPDYVGYNSPGQGDYVGDWGLVNGDPVDLLSSDPDSRQEDLFDEYRPVLAVIASDYNTYDSGKTYGLADKVSYDNADILNPAKIEKDQIFTVTIELGGFDAYCIGQVKGSWDLSKLELGYYSGRSTKTWKQADASTSGNAIAENAQEFSKGISWGDGSFDLEKGTFYFTAKASDSSKSTFVGDRSYGEYGMVYVTFSFKALEACDLREEISFDIGDGGTFITCYDPLKQLATTRPELRTRCVYGFKGATEETDLNQYGYIAPVIWANASDSGSEPVQHVHDFTGATAVSNGNGKHTLTCTAANCDKSEGYQKVEDCTNFTSKVTTKPTCTTAGVTTWTCEDCGYQYTTVEPAANGHTANYGAVDYQWTEDHSACVAVVPCSVCGNEALRVDGVVTSESKEASCTVPGDTTYTATFNDENLETQTFFAPGTTLPHTYTTQASDVEAKSATCTEAATYYVKCDVCGHVSDTETVVVGEPLGHDFTVDSDEMVSPATCEKKQLNKAKCSRCGEVSEEITIEVGELADHTPVLDESTAVEPTFDAPGKYADTVCSVCGEVLEEGAVRPAIAYYTITATAENGTATANGEASAKVAVKGEVTLVATPAAEGLEFVGWSLNDKIVSTEETYTTVAIANADYVAIYELAEEDTEFTVVFTDQYGNVYSTQTVSSASEIKKPEDPQLAGFTFKNWSMTDEEIAALDANATITAIFERADADEKFTVTVENGTIGDTTETTAEAAYNDKLTVKAPEGAVYGKWMLDDTVVGYGTSYTFFVGTDITLTYVEDTDALVNAKPSVAVVATEKDANSHKVAFFATRTLAADYEYVAAGFVYGKNMNADDLALANEGDKGSNENSGVVKVGYCSTDSEQFKLSYGLTSMNGTVSAKAFLAYVDAEGNTHIIYGTLQEYTY